MNAAPVHAYLRALIRRRDDFAEVGPFLAGFHSTNESPFANYGVPADGATPTGSDVQSYVLEFANRGRRARFEYIPTLAPEVEGLLLQSGFEVEGRYPLMVAAPAVVDPNPLPDDIEIVTEIDDDLAWGLVSCVHGAFGAVAKPQDLDHFYERRARGSSPLLARDRNTGEVVGGGELTPNIEGVVEVAGIGVSTSFRRRGIGAAITNSLLQEAHRAGASLAFLMAAGEAEQRIYQRAGFSPAGEVLHISLSAL